MFFLNFLWLDVFDEFDDAFYDVYLCPCSRYEFAMGSIVIPFASKNDIFFGGVGRIGIVSISYADIKISVVERDASDILHPVRSNCHWVFGSKVSVFDTK